MEFKAIYTLILLALMVFVPCRCSEPYEDLFTMADKNSDTFLTHDECYNLWWTFDGDHDKIITKLEFELRWTFLNLDQKEHAGRFFEELDRNFNKEADLKEVKRICNYFDDDDDGFVSKFEFDMNWKAFFTQGDQ